MKKLFLISLVLMTLCSAAPKPKKAIPQINKTVIDTIYLPVDLNDYLGFIDRSTDWNATELDDYTDSILVSKKIFYLKDKWVRKVSLKDFLNGK